MADQKKGTESLLKSSTFGDEADMVFDGFSLRPMTDEEKKATKKRRESRMAGKAVTDAPSVATVVQSTSSDNKSPDKKSS